jgi:ferritin
MLSKTLQDAVNEQIKNELYSAYLYLSMSAWAEANSLPGFAHWMRGQAREETEHAMKFFDFIYDRGGRVTLQGLDQPPAEFKSPMSMFEQTLEHEKLVTGMINNLYKLAVQDNDYASQAFLQWYVTEQVEEEKNATQIIDMLKMGGDKGSALLILDRQLGKRGAD